ncbi:1505_t:CDS:2, partial [Scutellospora calospora]
MQEHYNRCYLKSSNNNNSETPNQKELESLLAREFYSASISFNILENDDIKAFFSRAIPYFKLPTRNSLSNSLLTKEYSSMQTVVNHLLDETQFLCLVTDGWSNIHKDSIINYMITTPKPLFYKSVYTKEDKHMAQNIAEGIDKAMQELDINKFVAMITDNAPNMKAAWCILKNQYPSKIKDIMKLDWPKSILATSKDIINYFRNHNILLVALRRLQIEKYRHIIALVQMVDTRWGSAFYCMDHLLQTKNAIHSLLIEESIEISSDIKIHLMNDLFWQNLKHLCNYLEPFVKFIYELESDVPLLSAVFFKLHQLETTIRNNDQIPTIVITESINLVRQRWNDFLYNLATMVAYKLDPRYCGKILNAKKWDTPIERELIRLAGPENEDQVLEELLEFVGKTSGFSPNYLWGSLKEKPYNWWNLMKARYSVLSNVALKLLSIPATSASKLRGKGYLIEDNDINLESNETELVEESNLDVFLSDSSSYIDSMDYTYKISNVDMNENIDNLDSIDNLSNINNM